MSNFQFVRYEVRGKVGVITYDHQAVRNAWDVPMYEEIVAAVEAANADAGVGAIVFTHEGPTFCAGTNLKALAISSASGRRALSVGAVAMATDTGWLHLLARSKPSIAAIRGAAIGLGATQVLGMDIRIGARSSSYSFPFLSLGTMPELACTALLGRLVGHGRARDICLSAARLDADEAFRIGLISRLVDDGELLDSAVKLGERLAGFSSLPMRLTRDLLDANADEADLRTVLGREAAAFVELRRALKRHATPPAQP